MKPRMHDSLCQLNNHILHGGVEDVGRSLFDAPLSHDSRPLSLASRDGLGGGFGGCGGSMDPRSRRGETGRLSPPPCLLLPLVFQPLSGAHGVADVDSRSAFRTSGDRDLSLPFFRPIGERDRRSIGERDRFLSEFRSLFRTIGERDLARLLPQLAFLSCESVAFLPRSSQWESYDRAGRLGLS